VTSLVPRQEHESGAGDRLAYLVMSYGLLIAVAYRSLVRGEAAWDLLGLVVLGGVVGLAYRLRKGVAPGGWAAVLVSTIAIGALVAAALVMAAR
jgi:hypothetical protein